MAKLSQVSGRDVIRLLESLGYFVVRRRGSHVQLRKLIVSGRHNVTVPDHKVIAKGTLNDILAVVGVRNGIAKQDLIKRLRG